MIHEDTRPCCVLLPRIHNVRIAPDDEGAIGVKIKVGLGLEVLWRQAACEGMRVERVTIAQVIVARYDVVVDATDRKCAFEDGWTTCAGVALVVYGYARPAENVAGAVQRTSSVGSHALR
jgi:hypothetical protein